jgi:hypothetical protein
MLNKKLYDVKRTRDGETTTLGKYLLAADANAPKDLFQKILRLKENDYTAATVKGTPDGGYDIFDKDTQYTLISRWMRISGTRLLKAKVRKGLRHDVWHLEYCHAAFPDWDLRKNKGGSRGKVYCEIPDCLDTARCSVQENHGINTLQQKGW